MLKKGFIFFIGMLGLIGMLSLVSPYTAPTYDDINFSLCSGYTAPTYNDINFTLGSSDACITDTCTYSGSGNWEVDCSDNCSITSPVDLGGNNISIIGTGTFTTTANITNYNWLHLEGTDATNICRVTCLSGGCLNG